jgi:putative protease
MKRPEILAPGGSFSSAYYAFEAGADAVYLGLKDFSARKKAENFTPEEIRRLKTAWPDKKLYLALNTLLQDRDLQSLLPFLPQLLDLPLDAVILQDYGFAALLKDYLASHPSAPSLHASTQMAVHSLQGAEFLQSQGFSRIVLARELAFQEIAAIQRGVPELELEVFVHGANCYGFSGLCLASGLLLGRSANQGECAQVCRTWFSSSEIAPSSPEARGYWFSLGDRMDTHWIRDLDMLGIHSLKIEGRMKSPAYVRSAVSFCRSALDPNQQDSGESNQGAARTLHRVFHRRTEPGRESNEVYPGSQGEPLLTIRDRVGKAYEFDVHHQPHKTKKTLKPRDGLQVLRSKGGLLEAKAFSAKFDPQGRLLAPFTLQPGEVIYRTRTEEDRLPEINPQRFPQYKSVLTGKLDYSEGLLRLEVPDFCYQEPVHAMLPRRVGGMQSSIEKVLRQSGDNPWTVNKITFGMLLLEGKGRSELYFAPKALKNFRRNFYRAYAEAKEAQGHGLAAKLLETQPLDNRSLLDFMKIRGEWRYGSLPFLSHSFLKDILGDPKPQLPIWQGRRVLVLPPVLFQEKSFLAQLNTLLDTFPGPLAHGPE